MRMVKFVSSHPLRYIGKFSRDIYRSLDREYAKDQIIRYPITYTDHSTQLTNELWQLYWPYIDYENEL